MKELTEKVRELAQANGMDYVGVAPVERLQDEAEGRKPADFLPGAQSVVVIGVRLSLGAQLSNKLAYARHRESIYTYLWHGFGLLNLHFLDRTALLLARLLEREGYIAVPVHSSSPYEIRSSLSEFSNIHAAVAAGLGEMGWSCLCLTPDVGPRARFVSIITTAKLEPTPMYGGPRLCDPETCSELGQGQPVCVKVCPVGALGVAGQKVVIAGKSFEVARFDRNRCMWGSMGLSEGSLALQPVPMPDDVEFSDVFHALQQRDPAQSRELVVIGSGDYCGKCIMECPAGSPRAVDDTVRKAKRA